MKRFSLALITVASACAWMSLSGAQAQTSGTTGMPSSGESSTSPSTPSGGSMDRDRAGSRSPSGMDGTSRGNSQTDNPMNSQTPRQGAATSGDNANGAAGQAPYTGQGTGAMNNGNSRPPRGDRN